MNLRQVTKDCGRSVVVEVSEQCSQTEQELKAIIGLVDNLLRDNLGNNVDRNLFCAKEFLEQARREAR